MLLLMPLSLSLFHHCRSGQFIISGNADGMVNVWDSTLPPVSDDTTEAILQPIMNFVAHGDFVNGARWLMNKEILEGL